MHGSEPVCPVSRGPSQGDAVKQSYEAVQGFPGGSVKNLPPGAGDAGLLPGPGEAHGPSSSARQPQRLPVHSSRRTAAAGPRAPAPALAMPQSPCSATGEAAAR